MEAVRKPNWETFSAGLAERAAKRAEFEATPEGQAEIAKRNADEAARFESERWRAIAATGIPPKDLAILRGGKLTPTPATNALAEISALTLVCLSGNPGSGKTVAASNWLATFGGGLFVKAARLSRWDRYDNDEMNRLLRAARLVIDDLGTEFQDAKGNFMAILDEVIDVRYDHAKPTVITTNLDAEAFKARYGERIVDRIREAGAFVSLDGGSMRTRG